jgi:hypothetical protein
VPGKFYESPSGSQPAPALRILNYVALLKNADRVAVTAGRFEARGPQFSASGTLLAGRVASVVVTLDLGHQKTLVARTTITNVDVPVTIDPPSATDIVPAPPGLGPQPPRP